MTLWTLQRACDVQVAAAAMGAMNPVSRAALEQTVRESGPAEGRSATTCSPRWCGRSTRRTRVPQLAD